MLTFKKKFIMVLAAIVVLFSFAGCIDTSMHHEGAGDAWIYEQVERGLLTPEEADILLEQEKSHE